MSVKNKAGIFILPFFSLFTLAAAPSRSYSEESSMTRDIKNSVDYLKHETRNHENEIRTLEAKFDNLEVLFGALRSQTEEKTTISQRDLRELIHQLDIKVQSLEASHKAFIADLRQFKTHANESALAANQLQRKYKEMEQALSKQAGQIDHLQSALCSLTEVLQGTESEEKTYRVKPGDSLEKIARAHQTTVRSLKEVNGLASDQIKVGQSLRIR